MLFNSAIQGEKEEKKKDHMEPVLYTCNLHMALSANSLQITSMT